MVGFFHGDESHDQIHEKKIQIWKSVLNINFGVETLDVTPRWY